MIRSLILAALLAGTFSAIFFLPDFKEKPSAMSLEIPTFLGSWQTESYPPSEKELKILAKDTRFSKAHCALRRTEEFSFLTGVSPIDFADLSIVLSGYDLANSIHRPERCMPAQGHHSLRSSTATLDLDTGVQLPVTRILSKQDLAIAGEGERQHITRACVTYYFFVGQHRVTRSHTQRTLIDIKDRVFKGEAQSWAYVSITMPYAEQSDDLDGALLNLDQADKKIRQLLTELADENIDWSAVVG